MSLSFCYAIKLTQAKFPQNLSAPLQVEDRKRKRAQELEELPVSASRKHLRKRPRTSLAGAAAKDTCDQEATNGSNGNNTNPVDYWREKGRWPESYFKQDDQTRKDFEKDSWLEKYWEPESNMNHILARKKSSSSNRGKQSEASSTGSSDQKPRDVKSAPY
jgi:hypothetical protein